jgi:hypothetical protein
MPTSAPLPHWDKLKDLDRKALAAIWLQAFKRSIPPKLYKNTVVLLLGYRLQEVALGGLSPQTQRYLASLLPRSSGGKAARPSRRIKPGTRLQRTWQGRIYSVTVTEDGYEYGGKRYASLSLIARTITGTPWSGPAFFGLKDKAA